VCGGRRGRVGGRCSRGMEEKAELCDFRLPSSPAMVHLSASSGVYGTIMFQYVLQEEAVRMYTGVCWPGIGFNISHDVCYCTMLSTATVAQCQ